MMASGNFVGSTVILVNNLRLGYKTLSPLAHSLCWTITVSALLVFAGVPATTTVVLLLAVLIQAGTGAIWWAVLRQSDPPSAIGLVGGGLALGTMASSLSTHAFRATTLADWGWILPTVATVLALTIWTPIRQLSLGVIRRRPPLCRGDLGGITTALALGMIPLIVFWRHTPLSWDGWFFYPTDLPFHEALSHSVHLFGINDFSLSVGTPVRYHWLSHAWMGGLSHWSDAEPFVVLSRATPVVALVGSASMAWEWGRRLSNSSLVPPLAATMVVGSGFVGLVTSFNGNHLPADSPSQSFSTAWLLAYSFLLLDAVARRHSRATMPLLMVMSFCLTLGKASHALVVTGGLLGLAAISPFLSRKLCKTVWTAIGASGIGFLTAYLYGLAGSPTNFSLGFWRPASSVLRINPPLGGGSAVLLGSAALLLAIMPRWAGFVLTLSRQPRLIDPTTAFGTGTAAMGIAALLLTSQSGGGQLWFVLSASAVLSVLSASGLVEGLTAWRKSNDVQAENLLLISVLVVGSAASAIGTLIAGTGYLVTDLAIWVAPVVVWALVVMGVLVGSAWIPRRSALTVRLPLRVSIAIALVTASVAAPVAQFSALVVSEVASPLAKRDIPPMFGTPLIGGPEPKPSSTTPNAWTPDHAEAGQWLRNNSSTYDVVASNRQCSQVGEPVTLCINFWALTAALTQRRMVIEGSDYRFNTDVVRNYRTALSTNFILLPTVTEHAALWNLGTRWLWIDSGETNPGSWEPFGSITFINSHITVVRLNPPLQQLRKP